MPSINTSATVTSKMQLTIPINIANKVGIKVGEKVHVAEQDGQIIITPVKQLLNELAGSLSLPNKWKDKDIESIIQDAKQEHFKSKDV
jgi:AbrB family looped-hinge helix DNA binding protein